uniref:MORN repeat-containing protein 5 n=1 Tax=Glossina brevipalpis TaxID=37001 RepID=A0A1A9WTC9_9MUSC
MDSIKRSHIPLTNFLCGSKYTGDWSGMFRWMDGYGTYTFPNGSTYRGYFKRGKFHGFGTVVLAKPYNFVIRGMFASGSMESIDDMCFADGLHVEAALHDLELDFNEWFYCTSSDRRYMREFVNGIEPVGPTASLSANPPNRPLGEGVYDVGEGTYRDQSCIITNRPPPFVHMRVVTADELSFLRNCRKGGKDVTCTPQLQRKILNRNISTENLTEENECCERLKYNFARLCNSRDMDETQSLINDNKSTEKERSSFTVSSLHRQVFEIIHTNEEVHEELSVPTKTENFFVKESLSSPSESKLKLETAPTKSLTVIQSLS